MASQTGAYTIQPLGRAAAALPMGLLGWWVAPALGWSASFALLAFRARLLVAALVLLPALFLAGDGYAARCLRRRAMVRQAVAP